jgi:hypothetical protein
MNWLGMLVQKIELIADLRAKRNALLSATDYLALSDNTMTLRDESLQTSIKRYY